MEAERRAYAQVHAGMNDVASPYAGAIARLAPDENPALIEAWMRLEYGTLEGIDRVRFARAVQAAAERAHAAGMPASHGLARAYGLEPNPNSHWRT